MNENNKNAEVWDEESAMKFMNDSLKLAKDKKHDFIGEVARDMDSYRDIYTYLKDKFEACKPLYKRILQECEANCFSHGKKGDIVPSMAIVNLKSNHNWTDRQENVQEIKGNLTTTINLGNGINPDEATT